MKHILFLAIFTAICTSIFAQFGYKNKLETIDGIEKSYKVVHEKFFDKDSPAQLRLKLKNTNEYDVNINFEIEYSVGLTKRYKSEHVEICIPNKLARTGKMHGLVFEIKSNDIKVFESDDADWNFIIFEVEQSEDCSVL